VGLAKYVIRNKEHLGVVKFHDDMIILNELRYQTELIQASDLKIPPVNKSNPKEVEMAIKLIEQLTIPFAPQKYKDTYVEEMRQIIKQKAKGRPIHPQSREPSPKIHDIMSLLEASLEKKPAKKTKKTA
jgi:DNA end-binding protein Ku